MLCLPIHSFGQSAISYSRSYVINEDFSLWRSGMAFEYRLAKVPLSFSAGFNKVRIDRLDFQAFEPIPELQKDTSFGLLSNNYEHSESDFRLGVNWFYRMNQVDLMIGVEGIIGSSTVELTEAISRYKYNPATGGYEPPVVSASSGVFPIDVIGYATDQEYLKLGWAPRFGLQYHFSDHIMAGASFSAEFAKRTLRNETYWLEGPVSNHYETLSLIEPSILFEWKVAYKFLPKPKDEGTGSE